MLRRLAVVLVALALAGCHGDSDGGVLSSCEQGEWVCSAHIALVCDGGVWVERFTCDIDNGWICQVLDPVELCSEDEVSDCPLPVTLGLRPGAYVIPPEFFVVSNVVGAAYCVQAWGDDEGVWKRGMIWLQSSLDYQTYPGSFVLVDDEAGDGM